MDEQRHAIKHVYNNKYPRKDKPYTSMKSVVFNGCHDGAQGDPLKWELPGWRIEQSYSKNTLIGNWCEERNNFEHATHNNNSTNRIDYQANDQSEPECQLRRHALRRNDGSTNKYHGQNSEKTSSNISWYDSDYRRASTKQTRQWNRHKLVWEPEYSDHPVQGQSTQLGILDRKLKRWEEDRKLLNGAVPFRPSTTYNGDFHQFSNDSFPLKYAMAPKALSAQMNAITKTNKSLPLRGKPLLIANEHEPKL